MCDFDRLKEIRLRLIIVTPVIDPPDRGFELTKLHLHRGPGSGLVGLIKDRLWVAHAPVSYIQL